MLIMVTSATTPQRTANFAPMNNQKSTRPIAIWLLIGVGMLLVQIVLGGITRLTGSGLSITEWDVVTGTLPPLNESQWLTEFAKYKQTPQFRLLNFDFTLSDFKYIFFWEWAHRFWARLMGVVFLIPFLIFLAQRRFPKSMVQPLVILFLLGAAQGAVGWIMVASGLEGDAVYVAPVKLAMHFIFAMVLLCYTFWVAMQLLVRKESFVPHKSLNTATWVLIALLGVQFIFGALMAGHKAAPAAPTWPTINGAWLPQVYGGINLRSIIENKIVIHFIHRNLAYLLMLLVLFFTVKAFRQEGTALWRRIRWLPLLMVLLQVALGVATVLTSTHIRVARWNRFEWMAQLHQFTALLLLLSLIACAFVVRRSALTNKGIVAAPAL